MKREEKFFFFLLLIFLFTNAFAQVPGSAVDRTVPQATRPESFEPGLTGIKAKELIYDQDQIVARGEVELSYADTTVRSAEMDYDPKTGWIKSVGEVILEREGEKMTGSGFEYNVATRSGTMNDVNGKTRNIYFQEQPIKQDLFYKTKQIEIDNNVLLFKGVDLSTCDYAWGQKHYHITAETIKVIPSDKMIITNGRIWVHKTPLWRVKHMVIDLHPRTRQRQSYAPHVGWNRIDGFFIKTATNYHAYKDNYGTVLADFYQKTGIASGVQHFFPLASKGAGHVGFYHQNGSGFQKFSREQVVGDTQYDFGSGLRLSATGNLYRYKIPPINSPDTYSTQASLSKQGGRYAWQFSEQNNATSGFANSQTVQFHQSQDFGNQMQMDFSENFVKSIVGAADNTSLHNVTYFTKHFEGWSANLAFEKTTSTLLGGGFIDRTPELTLKSDTLKLGEFPLPYALSFSYGSYFESFRNLNASRWDFQFNLPQYSMNLGKNLKLMSTSLYRQDFYNTGTFYPTQQWQARYILGNETQLSSALAHHIDIVLDYRSQSHIGFDPLVYDTVSPYRYISTEVAFYNKDSFRLDIGTSYDYKNKFYQQLVSRFDWHPANRAYLHLDGNYDPNFGKWQNLVAQADIWPFSDIRLQYWSTMSLQNGQIGYQDIAIYKEWHDWEARLIYQWHGQGVFLFVNLKAFPEQQVQLGLNPLLYGDPGYYQYEVH